MTEKYNEIKPVKQETKKVEDIPTVESPEKKTIPKIEGIVAEEKKKNDAAAQKKKARDDKLTGMMQKINDKYGSGAISRGQKGFKNENTDHPAR